MPGAPGPDFSAERYATLGGTTRLSPGLLK
jgi:hypothetical protein